LPRLCTFDFIQYSSEIESSALSISSLFLFHSHIRFYLYIITYTYPFNLQSQKRIKKFFTVGFWTGLARLWIIFLVLGPGKKKKNTRTRMNPSRSVLPKAQQVDHSLCELQISIFKYVHCWAGCRKHANPTQSGLHPLLMRWTCGA